MSSSSLPPESAPAAGELAPPGGSPPRRNPLRLPVMHRGVFWAATPALALFALAILSSRAPMPQPVGSGEGLAASSPGAVISAQDWVVPASQTMLVSSQAAGEYVTLRGRLQASGGDKIAAPTSGEVAQILVQPGQLIKAGQKIALLTTGIAPAATGEGTNSLLDSWQNRAESAQIAAARQQESLESRMTAANEEMERAKERVTVAQQRVADARQLIARLQKGEDVSRNAELKAPAAPAPVRANATARANERKAALQESQKLQDDASWAEQHAKTAQKAVRSAQEQAVAKQQRLQAAIAAARLAEKKQAAEDEPAGEETSAKGDVNASRSVEAAREAASAAAANVTQLQRDATRLQARAREARTRANEAARRATQDLQLFGDQPHSTPAPVSSTEPIRNGSGKITIADAAHIARMAMRESEDAIADAERIRRKVETYSRPVQRTRRRFERATQELETAQRRIWENVPQMRTAQSAVTATRDGVVTWVTANRQVVQPGEALVAVGRPDHLEVVIADKSGVWKTLKPNSQVLALVQRRNVAAYPGRMSGGEQASSLGVNIPSLARVLTVWPPAQSGGAARIRIAVHNPPQQAGNNQNGLSPRAFAPGMAVFFSVSKPSRKTAIRIPTLAVRHGEGGKTFVAVLSPLQDQAQDRLADQCRVEWREVFLAPGDGISNRVKFGLEEGERVALRPDDIYSFTLAYGAQATVRVEQI